VNLWTVGCADPRLTAPARSPMDKPGKTLCVSPTLPTGRRLPTSFTAPRNKKRSIRFRGNGETISRLPAFSLFLPGSCPNNRDRRTRYVDPHATTPIRLSEITGVLLLFKFLEDFFARKYRGRFGKSTGTGPANMHGIWPSSRRIHR
jgi:hypothetical protein